METHAQRCEEVSVRTHQGQPAVWSPGPVSDDWIDEPGYAEAVEQVAYKTGAANHCAGCDGGTGVGKGELENPDCKERNACAFVGGRGILEEEPVVTDKAVAVAKHEREADGIEQNAAKASVHHAFD